MADIGLAAVAVEGGAVRQKDADVVEQGGAFDEGQVGRKMGDPGRGGERFFSHEPSVFQKYPVGFGSRRVMAPDDLDRVHSGLSRLGALLVFG